MSEYNFVPSTPGRVVKVGDLMRWRGSKSGEKLGGPYMCVKVTQDEIHYGDEFGNSMSNNSILAPTTLNEEGYYIITGGATEYPGAILEYCHVKRKPIIIL